MAQKGGGKHMRSTVGSLTIGFSLFTLVGCTSSTHSPQAGLPSASVGSPVPMGTVMVTPSAGGVVPSPVKSSMSSIDDDNAMAMLTQLWEKRTRESSLEDYPLGAGDVLEISVPNLDEIQTFSARITGDGTITLPLVGNVRVAGQTEGQLRDEIRRRLEATYMRDPQVNVFVREYRSRQVAVTGAVQKPGLYNLTNGTNTVLDLIGEAGGMMSDASPRVLLFPAEAMAHGPKGAASSPSVIAAFSKGPQSQLVAKPEPVVINLQNLSQGGGQMYLTLPVRPGDVLMVPPGGEVLVEGWVEKPGSYKITPGLTLLGTVVAAGGPHFAADSSAVELIRAKKDGGKISFVADLDKIKRGEVQDIAVQEGDIIAMPSSPVKVGPYGVYSFISNMVRVGASIY
jgi:polysaccharide biosynthesis/export protein